MLVFTLLKGVPARTTRVVTVGGVLRREEMDIVMNPHDVKAVEAADYVKRSVGGKVIAVTMGPESKLLPIMMGLYEMAVEGVDENVVLSDRRMAGADTLATAYAVSLGIRKALDLNRGAIDHLRTLVIDGASPQKVMEEATRLYENNQLPNSVYSSLPSISQTLVVDLAAGRRSREQTAEALEQEANALGRFIVLAGYKTTDGETGSVGPQVAEALTDLFGFVVPHVAYVDDFKLESATAPVVAERRIGRYVQSLRCPLPALLTIAPEYRPRVAPAGLKKEVRGRNYRGKRHEAFRWDVEFLGADPSKVGLPGSPTLVGPGVDVGGPPAQKYVGQTMIFTKPIEEFEVEGKKHGPFKAGEIAAGLPSPVLDQLVSRGLVQTFSYEHLVRELFGGLNGATRSP